MNIRIVNMEDLVGWETEPEHPPKRKGVTVERRLSYGQEKWLPRYRRPDGSRPSLDLEDDYMVAWRKACDALDEVTEIKAGDRTQGRRLKFKVLVVKYWLPTKKWEISSEHKRKSFLGDGSGKPSRKGRETELASKTAILFYFGEYRIGQITKNDVIKWMNELSNNGNKASTIKNKMGMLAEILQYAVNEGWIPNNATANVDIPTDPPGDDRIFTHPELACAFDRLAARGKGCVLWYMLQLDGAARYQDVAAVRLMDLTAPSGEWPAYWHMRTAVAHKLKSDDRVNPGEGWYIKPDKGQKATRVPISTEVYEAVVQYAHEVHRAPNVPIFDHFALKREVGLYDETRKPKPRGMSKTPYVKDSVEYPHGQWRTFEAGCLCPFCRTDWNLMNKYRNRAKGRPAARPWMEPDYDQAARANVVDPVEYHFMLDLWQLCVKEALGPDDLWQPGTHNVRHTSLSWVWAEGLAPAILKRDARHTSLGTTDAYIRRIDRQRPSGERLVALDKAKAKMRGETEPQPAPTAPLSPDEAAILALYRQKSADEKAAVFLTMATPAPAVEPERPALRVINGEGA